MSNSISRRLYGVKLRDIPLDKYLYYAVIQPVTADVV